MIAIKDLNIFIDKVLSLPHSQRRDLISLAEKHYTGLTFGTKDIYTYLYWRCEMVPRDHNAAIFIK